jgi:hypothetical protein
LKLKTLKLKAKDKIEVAVWQKTVKDQKGAKRKQGAMKWRDSKKGKCKTKAATRRTSEIGESKNKKKHAGNKQMKDNKR